MEPHAIWLSPWCTIELAFRKCLGWWPLRNGHFWSNDWWPSKENSSHSRSLIVQLQNLFLHIPFPLNDQERLKIFSWSLMFYFYLMTTSTPLYKHSYIFLHAFSQKNLLQIIILLCIASVYRVGCYVRFLKCFLFNFRIWGDYTANLVQQVTTSTKTVVQWSQLTSRLFIWCPKISSSTLRILQFFKIYDS